MAPHLRLHVNIDHVATVRQARRSFEPSLAAAASIAELAGADGITVHLRADRRHIQDADVRVLRSIVTTHLNMECATTDAMVERAIELRPDTVTLVPESPDEITTEGGLDVLSQRERVASAVVLLRANGLDVSAFVEPEVEQIRAAIELGVQQVELCTARYAEMTEPARGVSRDHALHAEKVSREIDRHAAAALVATEGSLRVAAGHGLTYKNVGPIAALDGMSELNIGHNIVARAVLVGLDRAVREMRAAIDDGRR